MKRANISGFVMSFAQEAPSACGSACSAAEPKPSACGAAEPAPSACGAAEPAKEEPKPSACGSACGAK